MKYNQPFGISDPNAPYINGNPSTGTMGSIPPAAAIEYPQREIVNVIALAKKGDGSAFATPDNADLAQLADVIQSGTLIYARDAGTANNYQVTLSPVPNAYYEGLTIIMRVANENTGNSVLNVNAMGAKQIVNQDGSQLSSGAMRVAQIVALVYDLITDKFRLVWTGFVTGMPVFLIAPRTLYVNHNTGLDTYDGTTATVSGGHGPFKTLQRAADEINKWNLNGFNVTVNVADHTAYAGFVAPSPGGNGQMTWNGNWTTLGNVAITATNGGIVVIGGRHIFRGFKMSTSGTASLGNANLIVTGGASSVTIQDMDFGNTVGPHINVNRAAVLQLLGTLKITGNSPDAFVLCFYSGTVDITTSALPDLVIPAAVSISKFANVFLLGAVTMYFNSISGAGAGSVTGQRYNVAQNGVINTNSGGASYYPGNSAGVASSGGQYL